MKKHMFSIILILSVIATVTSFALAQGQTKDQGAKSQVDKGQPVTVNGKIAFMKALGGYFVNGEDPAGEFMIVNQDPKLLEGLFKSGKKVTIKGRLRGADFLTIEKIDGKKYSGLKEPAPK
jgi:hypothetical protein